MKQCIINNVTGQKIKFIDVKCEDVLEMESVYPSFSEEPPMHFHPNQHEYFYILEGELTVRYKDSIRHYRKGDAIYIKANETHAMWNAGFDLTRVIWKVTPALDTRKFLEIMFKLANDGETNKLGRPKIFVLVYLLGKYSQTFRVVKPHITFVLLLFILLYPVFYMRKYTIKY